MNDHVRTGEGAVAVMGCVEVDGFRKPTGYGQTVIKVPHTYTMRQHRVAWEQGWGLTIPKGMHIMHTCDNPGCVNPLHLMIGTHADNMRDKLRKGRDVNQYANRTQCSRGHEYTPGSFSVSRGGRFCNVCQRVRRAQRRAAGNG